MKQLISILVIVAITSFLNAPLAIANSAFEPQLRLEQELQELDKLKTEHPEYAEIIDLLKAMYKELDLLEKEKESILNQNRRDLRPAIKHLQ